MNASVKLLWKCARVVAIYIVEECLHAASLHKFTCFVQVRWLADGRGTRPANNVTIQQYHVLQCVCVNVTQGVGAGMYV
jgi:hypothetical protein